MKQLSIRAFVLVLTIAGFASTVNARIMSAHAKVGTAPHGTMIVPGCPKCELPD